MSRTDEMLQKVRYQDALRLMLEQDGLEGEAARFLSWYDEHGLGKFSGESGVLRGAGCDDCGCCGGHVDLGGLADALRTFFDLDGL